MSEPTIADVHQALRTRYGEGDTEVVSHKRAGGEHTFVARWWSSKMRDLSFGARTYGYHSAASLSELLAEIESLTPNQGK